MFFWTVRSFEAAQIDHISGSGSSGQANFGGDIFGVVQGEYRASAAPTGGVAYTRGSRVGNAAPASGDPMGWVCVAPGGPGTWKALADIA